MGSKLLTATAAMVLWAAAGPPAEAQQPSACAAPSAWFPHNQTPEPNSAGFPAKPNSA